MKKLISMLLVVAMMLAMFPACGIVAAATEAPAKPVDVSLMTILHNEEYILENNDSWNVLIEDSGMNFSYKYATVATWQEEVPLSLNTGDYADVYWRCSFTEAQTQEYGAQEVFIDLKPLIKSHAPNLCAYLDENDLWGHVEDLEGHVWSLPYIAPEYAMTWNDYLFLNRTYLKNMGMESPKNLAEYEAFLYAVKEQDANGDGDPNDEVPLSMPDWGMMQQVIVAYMINNYDRYTFTGIDENGEVYFVPASEDYKEILSYLAKWYADGLINQDFGEVKWADWNAFGKGSDDIGSFTRSQIWSFAGEEKTMDYEAVLPFTNGTYGISSGIQLGGLCITDACECPELVVAMFDKLYSDEGSMLLANGIEGQTYNIKDGKLEYILGDYPDILSLNYNELLTGNAIGCGRLNKQYNQNVASDIRIYGIGEMQRVIDTGAPVRPKMQFTAEENEEISTIAAELKSYIATYSMEVARGAKDLDATWDKYVMNLEKMGYKEIEAKYQEAYKAALAE